ncbi:alpha/beta fold hydrolase [Streptomyces sp. TLI_171]|uniref:alpha/beta fold hydrolase n=1 Tax=Streptomyces sp. TLI_171 TaxID=1938859 RepID=UPI000C19048A|nr:alpha/beta hydrolase [Streptomyces sp. TLI_171]RKE21605.1 pimeloyl-ACP methyl ester carboxylesterase [Streptomyces sp. TLI_171]
MPTTGTLAVPGAVLHHRIEGAGPLLLISQSGEGDADRTVDLVPHLVDTFTVLTYDRRGLSRSRLDHPDRPAGLAEHADDVRRLLAAFADGPALMLGCSFGAVIGLHVAAEHPGLLRTLIAHEPVAPGLLDPAQAAGHRRELTELQELYGRDGLAATLPEMARVLGIDPSGAGAEPGLTPQPIDARRAADFDRFLRHDFTAVVEDALDLDAVRAAATRIVPAAGQATPTEVFDRRCAQALGELRGTPVELLPGGHNGNTAHPRAWAARLKQLL